MTHRPVRTTLADTFRVQPVSQLETRNQKNKKQKRERESDSCSMAHRKKISRTTAASPWSRGPIWGAISQSNWPKTGQRALSGERLAVGGRGQRGVHTDWCSLVLPDASIEASTFPSISLILPSITSELDCLNTCRESRIHDTGSCLTKHWLVPLNLKPAIAALWLKNASSTLQTWEDSGRY